jgi:hypothetical protein
MKTWKEVNIIKFFPQLLDQQQYLICIYFKTMSDLDICRHLWADCLDKVGSLTSHNTIGLHSLLQG